MDIPQDIIDSIIAVVSDDTPLLKQCSLVSSSFLIPSRKHLFSRITINSEESSKGIHQLLIRNPFIQPCVKSITMNGFMYLDWMTDPFLLVIFRLPFSTLESLLINFPRDNDCQWDSWDWSYDAETWDWNHFSSDMRDALSIIILSSSLKRLSLNGVTGLPITFFLFTAPLTMLELDSLTPNDFYDEGSISESLIGVDSKGIDRCVWRFGYKHARSQMTTDSIFLPFMCNLRILQMYIDLRSGTEHDFEILSFLIGSLSISLGCPEYLEFNIRFHNYTPFNPNSFYVNLCNVWRRLDTITTYPTCSRLRGVHISINYMLNYQHDDEEEPHMGEIFKAIHYGLPLLCRKGILCIRTILGEDSESEPESIHDYEEMADSGPMEDSDPEPNHEDEEMEEVYWF